MPSRVTSTSSGYAMGAATASSSNSIFWRRSGEPLHRVRVAKAAWRQGRTQSLIHSAARLRGTKRRATIILVLDLPDRFDFPVVNLPHAAASSPEAAVRFLVEHLVNTGAFPRAAVELVISQIFRRELLGSTAIGRGVALPHTKSDAVHAVLGVIGKSAAPIAWPDARDAAPVRFVCLLIAPADQPGTSMRALLALSRRLRNL